MCQLLESIRVENRCVQNPEYHQARFDASRRLLFGTNDAIDLKTHIQIPDFIDEGIYKCRLIYDRQIRELSFEAYQPKLVQSLKLVYDDAIDYALKYADRNALNRLFEQRGSCDDILIVKQGLITDTSFCNVIFYDGTSWITSDSPLLAGTRRQYLIDQKKIRSQQICPADLASFSHFMLINAMLDFDEGRRKSVAGIKR
jgi:4-amino-4-deoxychorismate lyase